MLVVRIVSWNLWWRFGDKWRERQVAILSSLKQLKPDLMGFQEVWGEGGLAQTDVIARALGMYGFFAAPSLPPVPEVPASPDLVGVELGVGVVSRWPILTVRELRLPSSHRPFLPTMIRATVDHPLGPLHIFCTATEWEPAHSHDQFAQIRCIAAAVTDPLLDGPLPVLLTADLNAPPDSPQLELLLGSMIDTWVAGNGDPTARTLRSENPYAPLEATKQIDRRIDYVLARPGTGESQLEVRDVFLLADPEQGVFPSDHDAVVVDLRL
jgi:endonuclease/exonuclease/phosphatase family metal-dependent hydrolase